MHTPNQKYAFIHKGLPEGDMEMSGLKRGAVELYEHEKGWETEAQNTISRLITISGDVIKDIQYIGSTSI